MKGDGVRRERGTLCKLMWFSYVERAVGVWRKTSL